MGGTVVAVADRTPRSGNPGLLVLNERNESVACGSCLPVHRASQGGVERCRTLRGETVHPEPRRGRVRLADALRLQRCAGRNGLPVACRRTEQRRLGRDPWIAAHQVAVERAGTASTLREHRFGRWFLVLAIIRCAAGAAGRRRNVFPAAAAAAGGDPRLTAAASQSDQLRRAATAVRCCRGGVRWWCAGCRDAERQPQQRDEVTDQQSGLRQPAEAGRHSLSTAPFPHDSCVDRSPGGGCPAIHEPTGNLPAPSTTRHSG